MGMHINNLAATTVWEDDYPGSSASYHQVPIPSMGIGAIRLWDSNGCSWRNIERTRGVYTWDRLDNAITEAVAAGITDIVYTLGCGPDWATTNPGQRPGTHVGYNPWPPADNTYWSEWCTAVGTRLAGKGVNVYYEIWNEVNDQSNGVGTTGSGFVGTVSQLVTLAQLAKTAISAVDASVKFLTPNFVGQDGIVNGPADCTLDNYLAAGGAAYADVVSVHGYNTLSPWPRPEGLITFAKRVRDTCSAHSISLPVWCTEWGYGTWQDPSTGALRSQSGGTPFPDPMPDQMGADYITRMMLLSWCGGFGRFFFYGLDATQSYASIVMVNPTSDAAARVLLTPAFAYQYVSGLLVGGRLSGLTQLVSSGVLYYRAAFTTGTGRTGYVYWCDDSATTTIPITGAVSGADNLGNALTLGATLAVTSSPKFIFYS